MTDIHSRKKKLEKNIEKLENSSLSKKDIEKLKELKDHMMAQGISVDRTSRIISSFNTLSKYVDNFSDMKEKELKNLVGRINQNNLDKDYSVWTLAEFKKAIKRFYRFSKNKEFDWLTCHVKKKDIPQTDPDELPDSEIVLKLIKACKNSRDKALIFSLWETGARISELLSIKWKHLKFNPELSFMKITESKTQQRKIPILECVENLKEWQENHPHGDNPNAFVFCKLSGTGKKPLAYGSVNTMLRNVRKRAEIPQHIKTNPHAFRKGRATDLASQGMNQAALCEYFGWVQSSDTAATYIRMAKKDLEKSMKQIYGIEKSDEEKDYNLQPIKCPYCETINSAARETCKNCDEVISKTKKLFREVKKDEIMSETKDELISKILESKGELSEEQFIEIADKRLEEKIEERMGI